MTISTKRLLTLLAALASAALLAAGCGDDNKDSGGSSGGDSSGPIQAPSGDTKTDDTPDTKSEAIDKCYAEADKLDGQQKDTARAACKAADTGDTDELKQEAKKQCLESTKQIPDEASRKQAEDACEKLGD